MTPEQQRLLDLILDDLREIEEPLITDDHLDAVENAFIKAIKQLSV